MAHERIGAEHRTHLFVADAAHGVHAVRDVEQCCRVEGQVLERAVGARPRLNAEEAAIGNGLRINDGCRGRRGGLHDRDFRLGFTRRQLFHEDHREFGERGARGEFLDRHVGLEVAVDAEFELERHEGIDAEGGERRGRIEGRLIRVEDGREPASQVRDEEARAILRWAGEQVRERVRAATAFRRGAAFADCGEPVRLQCRRVALAELRPVHLHHRGGRRIATEQELEESKHFVRGEQPEPDRFEVAGEGGVVRDDADLGERPPVHRDRGKPFGPAMPRQCIEEAIRRHVAGLRRGAEQRGDRRVHHEPIERHVLRGQVQVPRPRHLRRQYLFQRGSRDLRQRFVLKHHRGVNDAAKRWAIALNEFRHGSGVAHVASHDFDLNAASGQPSEHVLGDVGLRAAAARQHEPLRALIREPLGRSQAEPREAAGDEVRRIRANQRPIVREELRGRVLRIASDYELAAMLALGHEAEGVADLFRRKGRGGERREVARREQFHERTQPAADPLGLPLHEFRQIDGAERHARPERVHVQRGVLEDVLLADLDEATAGGEEFERAREEFAGQGVDHHVDAAALRRGSHAVREREIARMEDVAQALLLEEVVLFGAGRAEDFGTDAACDLDGGLTHAAGRRMEQHRFASLEPGHIVQAIIRGEERNRDGGGLFEADVCGLLGGEYGGNADAVAEAVSRDGHDRIAGTKLGDGGTDAANDAGTFVAERTGLGRGERVNVERFEHVAEVQPDGANFDFDLVRSRIGGLHFDPGQTVEASRLRGAKFEGRVRLLARRHGAEGQGIGVRGHGLIREPFAVPIGDFIFGRRRPQLREREFDVVFG